MKGVAFVTDLHLRSDNTKTEPLLLEQQDKLLQKIEDIAKEGSKKYESMTIVFLGDLTDRGIKDSIMFARLCTYFKNLSYYAKLYFVIGNHETTYKVKHNLFWHLGYGENLSRPSKSGVVDKIFEVVDYFDIDGTRIILNHHGCDINVPDDDSVKNIVVASHNNLSHEELRNLYQSKDIDLQEEYIHYIDMFGFLPESDKLRYVFKGHQHMLFGSYGIKETWGSTEYSFVFYDLSSLGRPKYTEFLQGNKRDIPVLEIEDDHIDMVSNFIELYDKSFLNLEEIELRQEKYAENKSFVALRKSNFSSTGVLDELSNLYSMDLSKTLLLQQAVTGTVDPDVARYMDIVNHIEVQYLKE